MENYKVNGSDLKSVADAIRTKGGTSAGLVFPDGFVTAIEDIPSGGGSTLITKSITQNGTYNASEDDADGYSSVSVSVPQSTSIFEKVGTYNVAEAWDKTGVLMLQDALVGYTHNKAIAYVLIFNNNTNTSGFRCDAIICGPAATISDLGSALGVMCRNYYTSMVYLSGTGRASAGTSIDVYRALHE